MAEIQAQYRKTLQELSKREDLANKICSDCSNPNPQWASVSFAIFLCLQCAGVHRGFGVHISFVRSISMDTWQEEQMKRMELGGNKPFHDFLSSYSPVEQGGYSKSMSPHAKYHCWAASQYREKLDAELAGKAWSQSVGPPAASLSPDPEQSLRRSRASNLRSNGGGSSPRPTSPPMDQKTANEGYFASLGAANASRSDGLPPSQGGKYTGFGSTPSPSFHPTSSAAAPSFSDLQENPVAALSKGWSMFSSVISGASKAVNDSVIQPGMERVSDPQFQASVRGYLKPVSDASMSANEWGKRQLGVDVAENVGHAVDWGKERIGGGPQSQGYGQVNTYGEETSGLYNDTDDDFFDRHVGGNSSTGGTQQAQQTPPPPPAKNTKKSDWEDDDWKDF